MKILLIVLLLGVNLTVLATEIYKRTNPDGSVVYTNLKGKQAQLLMNLEATEKATTSRSRKTKKSVSTQNIQQTEGLTEAENKPVIRYSSTTTLPTDVSKRKRILLMEFKQQTIQLQSARKSYLELVQQTDTPPKDKLKQLSEQISLYENNLELLIEELLDAR